MFLVNLAQVYLANKFLTYYTIFDEADAAILLHIILKHRFSVIAFILSSLLPFPLKFLKSPLKFTSSYVTQNEYIEVDSGKEKVFRVSKLPLYK